MVLQNVLVIPASAAPPTPTVPVTPARTVEAQRAGFLFRTTVKIRSDTDLTRLQKIGVLVLRTTATGDARTAMVLTDAEQLETLARLGFRSQSADELRLLTSAQGKEKQWLAESLGPLLAQADAIVEQTTQASAAGAAAAPDASAVATLRAAMHALTPEQIAGTADSISVDDDADGLTNTEEAWWCTDPMDPNSDGDASGYTDGQEVAALLNFTLSRTVRWGYGPPFGPPAAWPNFNNRDGTGAHVCNDGDYDSIPDYAEAYVVGTRTPAESTDGDKFDDGQELFGTTFCPGGTASCGYGSYPRVEYWNYIQADMPGWVRPPGDNPFIAAFPVPEVNVTPGSWHMSRATVITTTQGQMTQTEHSYETSVTEGQSTSIADSVTWNNWEEVSESLETPIGRIVRAQSVDGFNWGKIAGGTALVAGGGALGWAAVVGLTSGIVACTLSVVCGLALAGGVAVLGAGGAVLLDQGFNEDTNKDQLQSAYPVNVYNSSTSSSSATANANAQATVVLNNNIDVQGIANSLDGVQYAINQQGQLLARGLQDISYAISQPRYTETRTNGHSWGGAQTTTHEAYEEHTIAEGQAFTTGESWSTAWAIDSSHAANLTFEFTIKNTGTEYARELTGMIVNVYIGDDTSPSISYPAWEKFPNGKIENLFPGASHTFTTNPITLNLDQMRRIDLGERLTVVVEDYSYGADELFYENAISSGMTVHIEDGIEDGDESVDSYVIPTWSTESVLDVLARYFPAGYDAEGNINALWTPEFDGTNPPMWNEHYLSDIAWWNIYLTQADAGNTPLQDIPAQAGGAMLFRFNRDSDRDGYNDRAEFRYYCGLPADDPDYTYCTDGHLRADVHPQPEVLAGYVASRSGNVMTIKLVVENSGTFDAYGIDAVMYSPDDTTTIGNNTVGGNGRARPGQHVAVGSLVKAPDPTNWGSSTAKPYSGGNYTGATDRTYTFTAATPGVVGQGSTALSWSNGAGSSGSLNLGSSYHAPLPQDVADGLQIGLDTGTILAGASFTVQALTPRDTFTYTIESEPFTPPVIALSYSDPQGSHRFVTTVELSALDASLTPYSGQMLEGLQLQVVTPAEFNAAGANTTNLVVNNPHPLAIEDGHLYMNFVSDGVLVLEKSYTLDIPAGPTVFPATWSVSEFSADYHPAGDNLLIAFWTDSEGNIIDSAARPLSSFQEDPTPAVDLPTAHWDVGTIKAPQQFAQTSTLIGTSHVAGVVRSSTSYHLVGSLGQPASGRSTSTSYRLSSGYWAQVQAQQTALTMQQTGATQMQRADAATSANERFPATEIPIGSVGWDTLYLGAASSDSDITLTQVPSNTIGIGLFTQFGVQLNTDELDLGAFEKHVTVRTNDPAEPIVDLFITGDVQASGDTVFVYPYQSQARPLNKIIHVNSTRLANETVRFPHGITGSTTDLQPIFLYDASDVTLLGRGSAIEQISPRLRPVAGDSSLTDLILPYGTSNRRDYIVHYGYQAVLSGGGGQYTYQVSLPNQNYGTVALDIAAYNLPSNIVALSLDVGADGSVEWSFAGDIIAAGGIVHAAGLAGAVNAYLDSHGGATVVPMRLTTDTQGAYFLTNLRGTASTNFDLAAGTISLSDAAPMETDTVDVCTTATNLGQGAVPAAMVSFFVGDPATGGIPIGHKLLTNLVPEGGQVEGCISWNTTGFTGTVGLHAYVDPGDQVPETTEGNNTSAGTVAIRTRPDLSLDPFTLSDDEPIAGETVTVTLTLHNNGQTASAVQTIALYDGNPDSGGTLVAESMLALAGDTQTVVALSWTPGTAGAHKLFARADRDRQINEYNEGNNDTWREVYIGFAGPIQLDSGGGDAYDPAYNTSLGFGYLDGESNTFCGTSANGSQRSDSDGQVRYQFDHLLPGHFYHLDLILYECDGLGRQQQVRIDDNLISAVIDLSDLAPHRLSFRLDPAFYADRSIVVSVEELTGYDAIVSEINLHDIDYRYADAGASAEPAYSAARGYGWLDGVAQSTWGTLPYRTRRIDLGDSNPDDDPDNELRYRFDGLRASKRYQLLITVYQGSGTATVQQTVAVDSVDTGVTLEVAGVDRDDKVVDVPTGMYTGDGTITVRITRLGAAAGAFVNEIALEELTLLPEQVTQVTQSMDLHTGGPNWFSFNVKPPVRPAAACTGVTATSAFTSVYGDAILGGVAVPVGTLVEAYTPSGVKTGCFRVASEGLYGYMRVYGAEGTTPGMNPGDPITFKINGIAAAPTPYPVIWQNDKAIRQVDLDAADAVPVESLLTPIAGHYTKLQCETGTYLPPPADPRFNTCTTVAAGQSYLLWMNAADDLAITGTRVAANQPIELHAGYNWLGYLPTCELTVATALSGIVGHYDLLHNEAGTYRPPPANPAYNNFNTMAPGKGYMIHMTQAATLIYPANLCGTALGAPGPAVASNVTCPAVPTSRFTHFYGHVTPVEDAPPGAVILAYSPRGEIVGCGEVQEDGLYPYLRVYGAEDGQPGLQPGEPARFTVDGRLTQPSAAAIWQNDWDVHLLDLTIGGAQYYLPLIVR